MFCCGVRCSVGVGRHFGSVVHGGPCVVCAGVGVVGDVSGFGGQSFLMSSVMWEFDGRNFVLRGWSCGGRCGDTVARSTPVASWQ